MVASTDIKQVLAPGKVNWPGLFFFMLAVVGAVPIFWDGFLSLGVAWSTPEYSHGPLIPVLSAYLFLREMRQVPAARFQIRDRWPGFAVMALALAVAVLGQLVRIPDIITYGFIMWVAGLILVTFGARRGIFFWASVVHLIYMLPLPQFVYWQVTIQLQFISSEIGVWFIRMMGIPVFLEGNIIDLGVYKLQVAEACSGLRYLFPILSFSFVFAVLYRGPVWHKIVLLVAAAPITVLMNSFRIGVIGFMVDQRGIEAAEGFLHLFEGWVIFGACVAILFLMAIAMQRLSPNPKPLADTIDLEFDGLGAQAARVTTHVPSAALIAGALMTTAVSTAWVAAPQPETVRLERSPFAVFPRTLGDWSGNNAYLEPDIEAVLGADDYYSAFYHRDGDETGVDLFIAYYHKLTEGEGIHSPEVCIPTAGWEIAGMEVEVVEIPGSGWPPFPVNRAIIEKGLNQQLVYFWFEQRGRRLTNDYAAKAYTILDSLSMGRTDGALVRVITPILEGEGEASAEARLQALLTDALPVLPQFIPDETAQIR